MDLSPTLLIVLGLVCILLGYVACVLVNTLREESQAASAVDEAPPGGKRGRYTPITRLWRAKKAGALVVEINGKAFVSSSALNAAERAELEQSERDLRAWLGMGWQGQSAPVEPAAPPTAEQVPASPKMATGAPSAAATPFPMAPQPVSAPLVEADLASSSIVAQIDGILQDLLVASPFASRGIRLAEDPVSGVVVFIGAQRYPGIDSVPDLEAKALIQRAVREWESSQ